ncbi:DUF4296 domain-containing protein [Agriterribacter sp.]|uniref:DUF4296 domain-containing protein n=1 Tax=Agriterribacter sp. TaxID=2821509 RepID=UPI002C212B4C|nr:DUF4296 domain-containing protein [Agriterribacter sp.]HRO47750.1 DUF4296 domain-containing protein [Agriterribacter sp.]HRQ18364.1 DUF4296 domain-containing protein [Agriterribacter sp.]
MNAGWYIIMVAVWLLTGCSGRKVPSGVIEPHEMGNMLFEITMAEEFVNSYVSKDSSKNKEVEIQKEYQKIFLLHKVTEAQFKKSYDFYRSHTGIFKTMMDSLNARAQRGRNELYRMPN